MMDQREMISNECRIWGDKCTNKKEVDPYESTSQKPLTFRLPNYEKNLHYKCNRFFEYSNTKKS